MLNRKLMVSHHSYRRSSFIVKHELRAHSSLNVVNRSTHFELLLTGFSTFGKLLYSTLQRTCARLQRLSTTRASDHQRSHVRRTTAKQPHIKPHIPSSCVCLPDSNRAKIEPGCTPSVKQRLHDENVSALRGRSDSTSHVRRPFDDMAHVTPDGST